MLFWERVDIALKHALYMNTKLFLRVYKGNAYCYENPNSKSKIKAVIPETTPLLVSSIHNQDNDPHKDKRYAYVKYFDRRSQKTISGYVSLQSTHLYIEPVTKKPMKYEDGQDYVY